MTDAFAVQISCAANDAFLRKTEPFGNCPTSAVAFGAVDFDFFHAEFLNADVNHRLDAARHDATPVCVFGQPVADFSKFYAAFDPMIPDHSGKPVLIKNAALQAAFVAHLLKRLFDKFF